MSEQKSVWVIEVGEYSDYYVAGVFSTKENAERMAGELSDRSYEPEVSRWPLDPAVHALNEGMSLYTVHMEKDGTVERLRGHDSIESWDLNGEVRLWRRSQAPAYAGQDVSDLLVAKVWAKDDEHAVKIANKKRVQMIASGEWED